LKGTETSAAYPAEKRGNKTIRIKKYLLWFSGFVLFSSNLG